jgi:protein-disulfide isomerase
MRAQSRSLLWSSLVFVVVAGGIVATADSKSPTKKSDAKPAAAAPPGVLAEIGGQPIKQADFDAAVAKLGFDQRQKYYDLQRQILDQVIMDQIVEKEAKARGVSADALRKAEVDDKTTPVTPAEVDAFYAQNQGQMGGRSKEEMRPQLEQYLQRQRTDEARRKFETTLKEKSAVRVHLSPPRAAVEVPADAPSMGPADAPITIVEFTDYECPYCQRAQVTVDEITKQYGTKIRLIARDYPLDFHTRALYASRAVHCADDQGKFWDYHHDLLRHPSNFSDEDLTRRAGLFKLDDAAFKACLASDKHDTKIRGSQRAGEALGVTGTPAFFVNGRMINGALPREKFAELIDDELQRSGGSSPARNRK